MFLFKKVKEILHGFWKDQQQQALIYQEIREWFKNGDIDEETWQAIEKLTKYIKEMSSIGILNSDDELEDFVRQVGDVLERAKDNSKREVGTNTFNSSEVEEEGYEKVTAAKKD